VTELQKNYPAVKNATAFQRTRALTEHKNKRFIEHFAKVDSTFLSMFSFPLIAGDPQKALLTHDQVVISENVAGKFFGDFNNDYSQIIGKVLTIHGWKDKKDYIISGILKSLPKNSTLEFDLLMLAEGNSYYSRSSNAFGELSVFMELKMGYNPADVEKLFACYPVRRIDAEVLIDALCWISGTRESYTSLIPEPFSFIPESNRSIDLADGSITSQFPAMSSSA